MARSPQQLSSAHYETLAALRHAWREFLHFSEDAAGLAGIPPQQHQTLLAIKGFAGGGALSIGQLAERLRLRHHSAVGLVNRLVKRGLIRRQAARTDRRRVEVSLTARGEALIRRLSAIHLDELRRLGPELRRLLALVEK
jgi:DNA-binding MarR family transcriptional regulator